MQSLAGKGPVQKFNTGGLASTSGGGMQIVIENTGSPKEATGSEVDPQTGVTTIFLEDLQRNGPIAKGIQGTFNVKRGGFR